MRPDRRVPVTLVGVVSLVLALVCWSTCPRTAAPGTPPAATTPVAEQDPAVDPLARLLSRPVLHREQRALPDGGRHEAVVVRAASTRHRAWRIDTLRDAGGAVVRRSGMAATHFLVTRAAGADDAALQAFARSLGVALRAEAQLPGVYRIACPDTRPATMDRLRAAFACSPLVRYAEPDHLVFRAATPDDPRYDELWGLQASGDDGIGAPSAWDQHTGDAAFLVGVVDSGIDLDHEDLAANIWVNPGESGALADNGIDDDGNGYIDDVHGWDFYCDDNDPGGPTSHGTHVAGTIGAVGDNGTGVTGVCWQVGLVALQVFDAGTDSPALASDVAEALAYARTMEITVTNHSWATRDDSQTLAEAVTASSDAGHLLVVAAGNNGVDIDGDPRYPAAYPDAGLIAVTATDADGEQHFNYGAISVDLGAPGSNILSCSPDDDYDSRAGTSMAAPHVAGAAALLWSAPGRQAWPAAWIKQALLVGGEYLSSLDGLTLSGARLDIGTAMDLELFPLAIAVSDGGPGGGSGDADGRIEAGERIALQVTVANGGSTTVTDATVSLSVVQGTAAVSIVDGTVGVPSLAAGTEAAADDPLLVDIGAAATPQRLVFELAIDAGGTEHSSTYRCDLVHAVTVSGSVTLDGSGLNEAVVAYHGPEHGAVTTGADGSYELELIDGDYTLQVTGAGLVASSERAVTVPPAVSDVDFMYRTTTVSGRVTDEETGAAVADATVAYAGDGDGSVQTDAAGDYQIVYRSDHADTLSVHAAKPGHYQDAGTVTVDVSETGGTVADVDFALGRPGATADPASFEITLDRGTTATRTLTIGNDRDLRTLDWATWATFAGGSAAAPNPYDASASAGTSVHEVPLPSVVTVNYVPRGIACTDGDVYLSDLVNRRQIFRVDPMTGAVLGEVGIPWADGAYVGRMAADAGLLWVVADGLRAIDLDTGALAHAHAFNDFTVEAVAAGDGQLWALDYDDAVHAIDLDTGAVVATWDVPAAVLDGRSVRSFTWDDGWLWFPQDGSGERDTIAVDPDTRAVMATMPRTGSSNGDIAADGSGFLWQMDTSTDVLRLVDTGRRQRWLVVDPLSGSIDGGDTQNVALHVDADNAGLGTHHATVRLATNDPRHPSLAVAVTMHVVPEIERTITVQVRDADGPMAVGASLEPGGLTVDPDSEERHAFTGLDAASAHRDRRADGPVRAALRGARRPLPAAP